MIDKIVFFVLMWAIVNCSPVAIQQGGDDDDKACIKDTVKQMVDCMMGAYDDLQSLGSFDVMKILQTGDHDTMLKICEGGTFDEIVMCTEMALETCPAIVAASGGSRNDINNAKQSIDYMCRNHDELLEVLPCYQKSAKALENCRKRANEIRREDDRHAECRGLEWEIACSIGVVSNRRECKLNAVAFLSDLEKRQRPLACKNPDEDNHVVTYQPIDDGPKQEHEIKEVEPSEEEEPEFKAGESKNTDNYKRNGSMTLTPSFIVVLVCCCYL
ncbi:uncharacterized protein LOC141911108 isoform X2 [Tubulanus polymorphus]|uniref:uncharacterized protein LOC141911108 isoform X2 n=1 Tax=Tubulanus polymorphus TaxID=672921 RepID=UPI003DA4C8DD